MTLDEHLNNLGRGAAARLATSLGVSPVAVSQWRQQGGRPVTAEAAVAIESATERAVRRWDLRPADWHLIWPELIGADGAPAVSTQEPTHVG